MKVINLDEERIREGKPKLFDLLISKGDFTASVEIKGENGTVNQNNLDQVKKNRIRFQEEFPNVTLQATILLINHQYQRSPTQRDSFAQERIEQAKIENITIVSTITFMEMLYQYRFGLPVETITYSLEEGEQVCTCCGGSLHEMSTETRNEIAVVPPQVKVIRHVRNVYACRHCEREDIQTKVVTAAMPKPVYPGSLASPSSMAYVMSQKYVDSLPLYRQEQHFARLGYTLSRQTMANWMIYGAEKWLMPLVSALKAFLLKQDVLHADETTLQVCVSPGSLRNRPRICGFIAPDVA